MRHTGHLDIVAGLNATRVGADTVSKALSVRTEPYYRGGTESRQTYCFGAVVLTWHLSAAGHIERGQERGQRGVP